MSHHLDSPIARQDYPPADITRPLCFSRPNRNGFRHQRVPFHFGPRVLCQPSRYVGQHKERRRLPRRKKRSVGTATKTENVACANAQWPDRAGRGARASPRRSARKMEMQVRIRVPAIIRELFAEGVLPRCVANRAEDQRREKDTESQQDKKRK